MSQRRARLAAVGLSPLLATLLAAGCAGASTDQGLAPPPVAEPTTGYQRPLSPISPSPWSEPRLEWLGSADNFMYDSLEGFSEDLWGLEDDIQQGTATEPDMAWMARRLVEQADDLQDIIDDEPPVIDRLSARVKKLSSAAARAREAGTQLQDVCDGEGLVSESSKACQGGYDRLLASYVELQTALEGLRE